jgi:hypothetical protein
MVCGAAWGQNSAPPPDKPQPRTLKAAEVPEALAYRIFFQELAAYQRKADELEAQGKNASLLRNRHRQLTALTEAEFQTFTASVGQLRANLGAKRFACLDQVVRMHVARNVKIYGVQQPNAASSEGN